MAVITDYTSLKNAVSGWLDSNNPETVSAIDQFIRNGESRIYRWLRHPTMTSLVKHTYIGPDTRIPVPDRFLGTRVIYRPSNSGNITLEYLPPDQFYRRYEDQGNRTWFYTILENYFDFHPAPAPDTEFIQLYYKRPDWLIDQPTVYPSVFLENTDLYLYAALVESVPFKREDARLETWMSMYDRKALELQTTINKYRYPEAQPLRMVPDTRGARI